MPPGYDDSSPVASCSSCSLHVALPAVWWSHTASIVWRSCETASPNLNGETLVMTVDTLGRKMWKTHGETLGNDLQMMDENQIYVSWGEGTTWFGLWTFMMSSFVLFFHNPPKKTIRNLTPSQPSQIGSSWLGFPHESCHCLFQNHGFVSPLVFGHWPLVNL